ncbi:putative halogenase [Mycena olivaceomarginata]|nr:putative halogenase [Mycena olivaceomarginata]
MLATPRCFHNRANTKREGRSKSSMMAFLDRKEQQNEHVTVASSMALYAPSGTVAAAVQMSPPPCSDTDFISPDPNKASWNVMRSEFDEILLRHATESGACVCESVQVASINFSSDDPKCPVSAEWKSDVGGKGEIRFKWLIDASGRTGSMSTKYLKNRKFNQALKNIAFWGYWTGAGTYMPGTRRENAPWFEWAWFIPLNTGTVSVGVVLKEESSRLKRAKLAGTDMSKTHYLTQLSLAPGVLGLLGNANLTSEVKSAGDYSYSASSYAGPSYYIVGDAGAFAEAIRFHSTKTGTSYTRFLLVVLSIYRQITAQDAPVLSDIDEDNFDRAFDFLRPIIQGAADSDQTVTEQTLQRTMDFCEHGLGPTTPEMQAAVVARVDPSLLLPDGPVMITDDHVLLRVNARKTVDGIYDWEQNFQCENIGGFSVLLERGRLGLRRL